MPEPAPASSPGLDRIPVIHPQVAATHVDGQVAIILVDSGQVLALNETGAFLWDRCNGQRTLSELSAALHAEFAVPLEQAQRDTLTILERLAELGAIQWAIGS